MTERLEQEVIMENLVFACREAQNALNLVKMSVTWDDQDDENVISNAWQTCDDAIEQAIA